MNTDKKIVSPVHGMEATKMDIRKIFWSSVRLYFAPLTGAVKGVRSEWHRIYREQHPQRDSQKKPQV